ncbi:MAG: amidohydrolase family protein [Saprospiraceae bacterium]
MKGIILSLLAFFVVSHLHGQGGPQVDTTLKMDFELYDPPSTLVVPEHPVTRAKFPFVDCHSHHWNMATQDLDKLIREMDTLNMGMIINLSGRGGPALAAMMENVKKYGYEDRILIFTNIELRSIDEPDWAENTVKQLEFDVEKGARGLKIYKSQGMSNVDKAGNRIKINDPRIAPVWEACGRLGIPVIIHSADPKPFWDPLDENNERWLELKLRPGRKRGADDPAPWETIIAEQHDLFRKHPKTTFINAHMGWFANDLQKLGELLDEMPNMHVGIGAVIAELGRQPRNAKKFFEKYQDRVLFAKDAYNPEEYHTYFRVLETDDEYFPYYKKYHAFWRMYGLDLSDEVLKKLYYKNALRIIPGKKAMIFPE